LARLTRRERDWVGLAEASRLLGVSPATLRRWSDAGRLRVFTTPGGHRRFSREALQRLLPAERSRRPLLGGAGLTPARIARSYRRASREFSLPWVLALTDEQRLLFRERGHVLAAGLLQYLDASQPEAARHHLAEASRVAAEYGRVAADLGLSLSQTVEGFLRFRAPFFHELVVATRRRGFDTAETTDLIELAERGMDELLVATMTGHGGRATRRHVGALGSHAIAETRRNTRR
jgi:excisionase family DNA binding protein